MDCRLWQRVFVKKHWFYKVIHVRKGIILVITNFVFCFHTFPFVRNLFQKGPFLGVPCSKGYRFSFRKQPSFLNTVKGPLTTRVLSYLFLLKCRSLIPLLEYGREIPFEFNIKAFSKGTEYLGV